MRPVLWGVQLLEHQRMLHLPVSSTNVRGLMQAGKRTRNLGDCILAHAVTNACLGVYVLASSKWEYLQ